MGFTRLIILSMALGTDLFSVSLGVGLNRYRLRQILKASLVFSFFHIFMLLTGYNFGHLLGYFLEHLGTYHNPFPHLFMRDWADFLGACVLIVLGVNMIWQNVFGDESLQANPINPLRGMSLVLLALSVSVDAMAVGFGLGMLDVDLIALCAVLGAVIFIIAVLGLVLGRKLGIVIGQRAELLGGLVLILLGVNVLL